MRLRIIWEHEFGYSVEEERQPGCWYYIIGSLCLTKWGAYFKVWRIQRRRRQQLVDKLIIWEY